MKHLHAIAIVLGFCLHSLTGYTQPGNAPKPPLFNNFPDIINCAEPELDRVFTSNEGQLINLSFSSNFNFAGTVISNVVKYSNLKSAVIKSPAFHNAIFHLSKRINDDNSITYVGVILNQNYFDGYELRKDAAGNYQLIKMETDKVIQDCGLH